LLATILESFAKEREIFAYYMANLPELEAKLIAGEQKAMVIAQKTMSEVRALLKF
jgi:tryptophanyl-tRNA synthetase